MNYFQYFIIITSCLLASNCSAQFFKETIYHTEDGLVSNEVSNIIQSSDEYIWIINGRELLRYDGNEFTELNTKDFLHADNLRELSDGQIMFTSEGNDYLHSTIKANNRHHNSLGRKILPKNTEIPHGVKRYNNEGEFIYIEENRILLWSNDSIVDITDRIKGENNNFKIDHKWSHDGVSDNKDGIWFNINGKLFLYKKGNIELIDSVKYRKPKMFFIDPEQNLWIVTEKLIQFTSTTLDSEHRRNYFNLFRYSLINRDLDTLQLALINDIIYFNDNIWLAQGEGIYKLQSDSFIRITEYECDKIERYGNQGLLFYNSEGVVTELIYLNDIEEVSEIKFDPRVVNDVISDKEGNIWIASNNGLSKFTKSSVHYYNFDFLADAQFQSSMVELINERYEVCFINQDWIDRTIYIGNSHTNQVIKVAKKNAPRRLQAFLREDEIYIYYKNIFVSNDPKMLNDYLSIGWGPQLYKIENYLLKEFNIPDTIIKEIQIKDLVYQRPDGELFLRTKAGIYYLGKENISFHSIGDTLLFSLNQTFGIKSNNIYLRDELVYTLDKGETCYSIEIDVDKNTWITTLQGNQIIIKKDGQIIKIDSTIHPISESYTKRRSIVDSNGGVWISTQRGLYYCRLENDEVKSNLIEKNNEGLLSNIITDMLIDSKSVLWVSTNKGINKIDVELFDDSIGFSVISYTEANGLKDVSVNNLYFRDSSILALGNKGYSIINPRITLNDKYAPVPFLNEISWVRDGALWEFPENIFIEKFNSSITYLPGPIYFEFNAIKFNNAYPLQFSYILKKEEKEYRGDIRDWYLSRYVKFESLAPGNYKLEIYSKVGEKGKASQAYILEFRILPAWHQTLWFKLLVVLSIAMVLYMLYRLRISKLKQNQKVLENKISSATKEIKHQKEEIEEQHREMKDSISYARRIQEAILPPTKLIKEYLKDSFILFKPKDIVAGDFYWFETNGDDIYFAAADCTGHGVPGAMVSVVCANALHRVVNELKISEPAKILDKVRELVVETFEKSEEEVKDGMDISFCKLNLKTRKLTYSGAHNPLYRITPKNSEATEKTLLNETHMLVEYKGDKQPIGKWAFEKPFTQIEIQLLEGDSIYISSDGYPDQFGGEKGRKFMYKPFKNLFLSIHQEEMDKQKEILANSFDKWKGDHEQVDDVCVIGVRV